MRREGGVACGVRLVVECELYSLGKCTMALTNNAFRFDVCCSIWPGNYIHSFIHSMDPFTYIFGYIIQNLYPV